jgi:hypothetical protein
MNALRGNATIGSASFACACRQSLHSSSRFKKAFALAARLEIWVPMEAVYNDERTAWE